MPSQHVLKSVVHNFIETYISRNTDYEGYWLFGFLVAPGSRYELDLLTRSEAGVATADPLEYAQILATERLHDLLEKARFGTGELLAASAVIEVSSKTAEISVNGYNCAGHRMCVAISVVSTLGRHFRAARAFLVAPHEPRRELRSARASAAD